MNIVDQTIAKIASSHEEMLLNRVNVEAIELLDNTTLLRLKRMKPFEIVLVQNRRWINDCNDIKIPAMVIFK